MHAFTTVATFLLAASSAIAGPIRRQDELDTKVRVILRDDAGLKQERDFASVDTNISTGVEGSFTTVEIDIGADVNPALRCSVIGHDGNPLFALRGANRDTTFSDATNGEWNFEGGLVMATAVKCDQTFVADNRPASA